MASFIQWNCRGLKSNRSDLDLLISKFNPSAICLQETLLHRDLYPFRGYVAYHLKASTDVLGRPHGGVSIFIKTSVPQNTITLQTPLKAVAARITLKKTITLCNIYISPSDHFTYYDLENLIHQLPVPYIIFGDFNAHNTIWGGNCTDPRGRILEDFIIKNDVCLMNAGQYTYIHPGYGTQTAIDLTMCHSSLYLDYNWDTYKDTCGSDHLPIILTSCDSRPQEKITQWQLHKANWELFKLLCEIELSKINWETHCDPMELFTSTLEAIAEQTIPKSSTSISSYSKPWFDEECRQSIRHRNKAYNTYIKYPTASNLLQYRQWQAHVRRLIKDKKRYSWKNFVSKLTSKSPVKQTWNMVSKIIGRPSVPKFHHLRCSDNDITDPVEMADCLADTFSKHSSSEHYREPFKNYKSKTEKIQLSFQSSQDEAYNEIFSLKELKDSLREARNTLPGIDGIPYQILRELPLSGMQVLLNILNFIWQTGLFPLSWRKAIIIPIPKPGKDQSDPANHRPIALTSCICKTMERMINKRLTHYLESNDLLSNFQCGFRKGRSTLDHLVRLETYIRDAFINKQHAVAVFFDLEKAYDTTWKYGIMRDLHHMGLRGRLPVFIQNFLSDRTFQVRLGNTVSTEKDQEMGVPQGSVLSVTLFSIKIDSITKCLQPGANCSLYVDDFLICYRSSYMPSIERQLQHCLNKLQTWADENGFKFSPSKTAAVHFCCKRTIHSDPELLLYGSLIPVETQAKFLGVIFDKKLSFLPHIKKLKTKCHSALNILKVVGHFDWGADRKTLLSLYRSLVRSKLDYGSIVYGSARRSYRSVLDTIQNQALRICLGAFRTSPVDSIHVEANEPPLEFRRRKLALQYAIKMKSNESNPAFEAVFHPSYEHLYEDTNHIRPFGIRCRYDLEELGLDLECIHPTKLPSFNPWQYQPPVINTSLGCEKKGSQNPEILRQNFLALREHLYKHHCAIYTDGSKAEEKVAAAAYLGNGQFLVRRLPDNSSIYSAELTAINLALNHIGSFHNKKFVIFTDSISCLQALEGNKLHNPLLQRVISDYISATDKGNDITFCWVPSHVGISGNETADAAAKESINIIPSDMKVPFTDFRGLIKQFIWQEWQSFWLAIGINGQNKLYPIKPRLGEWYEAYRASRREETILARLRIGHSHLTHSYLLKGESQPMCHLCNEPLTIKHLLIDCQSLAQQRARFYNVRNIKELFENINPDKILAFIKHLGLFNKI